MQSGRVNLSTKDKTVIVTGSTSGIGLGILQAFAAQGFQVEILQDFSTQGFTEEAAVLVIKATR